MPNAHNRLTAEELHASFTDLRREAHEVEPASWWLNQSELTTLGYEVIVQEVADGLARRAGDHDPVLLDWGAGPGFTTFLLEQLGVSTVYYDFEHDYPSYRYVLSKLASPKVFMSDDPTVLPFDDRTFDGVLSCGVLEHVPQPEQSLHELYRVLRPGGQLFIYHFPNRYSYTEAIAGLIGQSNHETRWSKGRMLRTLRETGFEVTWFQYRYMIPRNLIRFPRARRFFSEHAEGLYRFDRVLSRVPPVNVLANALNCIARKPLD